MTQIVKKLHKSPYGVTYVVILSAFMYLIHFDDLLSKPSVGGSNPSWNANLKQKLAPKS